MSDHATQGAVQWLVMVYLLANDDALYQAAKKTLDDLCASSTSTEVGIFVQIKGLTGGPRRFWIHDGAPGPDLPVTATNMGTPQALTEFVDAAHDAFTPGKTFLVVSAHGAGIDDTEDALRLRRDQDAYLIATDGGSSLSNAEFKSALSGRHVDVLGCDACYMGMIELAYEMKGVAGVLVASQSQTPVEGWPYAPILGELIAAPSLAPMAFAKRIVDHYGTWFQANRPGNGFATLVACNLEHIATFVEALDPLADALKARLPAAKGVFDQAKSGSEPVGNVDYIDAQTFLTLAFEALDDAANLAATKQAFAKLGAYHWALDQPANQTGLNIFLLPGVAVSTYKNWVDFAAVSHWPKFVAAYPP